jgi:hypothetical protein
MCSKNVYCLKYYDYILAVESHRSQHFCLLFSRWKDMYLGYQDREAACYFCEGPQCWCERYLLESVNLVGFFIFLSSWALPFLLIQYCIYVVASIIRLASCMIASGCDDGSFTIRDLRIIEVPSSWRSRVLYACLLQTIHLKWCFSLICVLIIYFWVRLLFACLCTQYSERKIEVEWHFEYNRRRVKWHFE